MNGRFIGVRFLDLYFTRLLIKETHSTVSQFFTSFSKPKTLDRHRDGGVSLATCRRTGCVQTWVGLSFTPS